MQKKKKKEIEVILFSTESKKATIAQKEKY